MIQDLTTRLSGGDRRSPGAAAAVAREAARDPAMIRALLALSQGPDPLIGMRAADALEKACRIAPGALQPHVPLLLGPLATREQQELRWHLLQILPRLALSDAERLAALRLARKSLTHPSRIVVTEALSCLFALSGCDPAERAAAMAVAQRFLVDGPASARARARKLLAAAGGAAPPPADQPSALPASMSSKGRIGVTS